MLEITFFQCGIRGVKSKKSYLNLVNFDTKLTPLSLYLCINHQDDILMTKKWLDKYFFFLINISKLTHALTHIHILKQIPTQAYKDKHSHKQTKTHTHINIQRHTLTQTLIKLNRNVEIYNALDIHYTYRVSNSLLNKLKLAVSRVRYLFFHTL